MIKIAVGLPSYRSVLSSGHAQMWMQFGGEIARRKDNAELDLVMFAHVDVCGIDRARNILMAHAMRNGADWLLMIDSDTWAHGKHLVRMIGEAPECAIVGAAVVVDGSLVVGNGQEVRGEQTLNIYEWNEQKRKHRPLALKRPDQGSYQNVDAIGGAVIAINLRRVGDLDFRWHRYEDGSTISEDLYFCRRLREHNQKILVDTRVITTHVGKPKMMTTEIS